MVLNLENKEELVVQGGRVLTLSVTTKKSVALNLRKVGRGSRLWSVNGAGVNPWLNAPQESFGQR